MKDILAKIQLKISTLLLFHPSPVQAVRLRPRLGQTSPSKLSLFAVKRLDFLFSRDSVSKEVNP